ncbi:MAG: hypothetical protein DRQ62_10275 [Gammaproteobacteria bacterium]|nr:MAG: hypothetical protein DRQ62_10275 [Gammaproteobacteria bacterium]
MTNSTKAPVVAKTTKIQTAAKIAESDTKQKEFIIGVHKVTASTKLKYKPNPKRKNSKAWLRYESYSKAKNFAQYQKLNQDKQSIPDLKYDLSKSFVEIS